MGIELVTMYDDDGNDCSYTETVPDMPEQDEPDCYTHNSNSCPCMESECDGTVPQPVTGDAWGTASEPVGYYSMEPPF
ncbi:hypothetical protein [Streptomyces sp. ISL-100]|uniref:hypothetical protein n=1 Tax=Streptomyces sp. ISL-100 TaxID=2819173 RepID=UPI001BE55E5D|nr:hypothetical protein [Streptomyces sp. ISL-100]MBT2400631.1 hypothetical protein [Streptomyces sp. ISL-100]